MRQHFVHNFFVGVIVNNLQSVAIEERDDLAEIRNALARLEARVQTKSGDEKPDNRRVVDVRTVESAFEPEKIEEMAS